ncbi:hypothetical protein IQ219_10920 [Synechocystis sp. LEGE 06083]|uniref:hypothetical protein n=1 Tax=Synechocystis sp. LEGE 06083 TaxID=915336 RepID=UPI00187F09CE|nr:hypothetical protein [Synechocystis sp. LEGE 06083]MBE9195803.1 hypothetical protein [Synechocystis sp. LEGE 06083]
MEIVAGITLKSIDPRVWDKESPYHLLNLKAVMISYGDFHKMPKNRQRAMELGLHQFLNIPKSVKVYLDNGSFYFLSKEGETPKKEYEEFVRYAKPNWWPIPQDFIPTPKMTIEEQESCFDKTMAMNISYQHRRQYTSVIHVSNFLEKYIEMLVGYEKLSTKNTIALGGIVPNLLKAPKALPHRKILDSIRHVRNEFKNQQLHVFGIGGTATIHLASLLGINSADSSGWRNRAARGIIQLPGTGDRMVASLGSWRGRELSTDEERKLKNCQCPACLQHGIDGLKADKKFGFVNRATHNLWVLLEESKLISTHLLNGTYEEWFTEHLDNTMYYPLIQYVLKNID